MITQARIKTIADDFNGITAAYASYYDRYRALPGDDFGAQARWALGPTAAPSTPRATARWTTCTTPWPRRRSRNSGCSGWHLRVRLHRRTDRRDDGPEWQRRMPSAVMVGVTTGAGRQRSACGADRLLVCQSPRQGRGRRGRPARLTALGRRRDAGGAAAGAVESEHRRRDRPTWRNSSIDRLRKGRSSRRGAPGRNLDRTSWRENCFRFADQRHGIADMGTRSGSASRLARCDAGASPDRAWRAAVLAAAPSASALVPIVDQQQDTANAQLGTFREYGAFAQSFAPGFESLAGAGLMLGRAGRAEQRQDQTHARGLVVAAR